MRKIQLVTGFTALFAILLPFQNCSIYQSEGKKFIANLSPEEFCEKREEIGASCTSDTESDSKTLGKFTGSSCDPYIDRPLAESMFGADADLQLYYNPDLDQLTCLASSRPDSVQSLNTVVCSISLENLNLLLLGYENPLNDPHPAGPLSGGSLGFVSKNSDNVTLHFLGTESGLAEAAHCAYTFSNEAEYQENADLALERASQLVHAMVSAMQ